MPGLLHLPRDHGIRLASLCISAHHQALKPATHDHGACDSCNAAMIPARSILRTSIGHNIRPTVTNAQQIQRQRLLLLGKQLSQLM